MGSCVSCKNLSGKLPKGCKNHDTCGTNGCNKLTVFDWLGNINTLNKYDNQLVEIRFKNDRKAFYKNSDNTNLNIGDIVAVESYSGHDIGIVSLTGTLVAIQFKKKNAQKDEIKKIYRLANQKDIDIWKKFREEEYSTLLKSRKISKSLNLVMKICDVEYQGDGSKATFYYTSDSRVDFRELIKEFALIFRCKIDMKQIGYRQESAKIGGIGSCGRELCCSSWLTDFRSVNTMAARYQQLAINPQKLAGQCGKLKCCLNFELDSYLDALQDFPSQNTILLTKNGKAFCLKVDVFRKKMWFVYNENLVLWFEFKVEEVKKFIEINKKGEILASLEELKQKHHFESNEVDIIQENNLNRFEFKNVIYNNSHKKKLFKKKIIQKK